MTQTQNIITRLANWVDMPDALKQDMITHFTGVDTLNGWLEGGSDPDFEDFSADTGTIGSGLNEWAAMFESFTALTLTTGVIATVSMTEFQESHGLGFDEANGEYIELNETAGLSLYMVFAFVLFEANSTGDRFVYLRFFDEDAGSYFRITVFQGKPPAGSMSVPVFWIIDGIDDVKRYSRVQLQVGQDSGGDLDVLRTRLVVVRLP